VVAEESSGPFDSVIVGLAPSLFTYEHLNAAFRILMNEQQTSDPHPSPGAKQSIPLIATHKAKYIGSSDGALSLGPGPFVTALENAASVESEIVGKPTRSFFEAVIRDFRSDNLSDEAGGQIALIGDDIEADLGGGAVELQLWRILGKFQFSIYPHKQLIIPQSRRASIVLAMKLDRE
jgi:ribonucleotide monophosphatase NagD (HAD superfamily)